MYKVSCPSAPPNSGSSRFHTHISMPRIYMCTYTSPSSQCCIVAPIVAPREKLCELVPRKKSIR